MTAMKSGKNRKNLKIAGATILCIFSLATAFSGTMAWFASSETVTATGMTIRVTIEDTDLNALTVHRCDLSNSTSSLLKFDSTPSVSLNGHGVNEGEVSLLTMDNYTTLNQTQPVLLLFTFPEGTYEDDIDLTATTPNVDFVSSVTTDNVDEFPFSSAVTFKVLKYSSASFPFDNVQLVDNNSNQLYTTASFVTIDTSSDTYSYNQTITLFSSNSHTSLTHLAVIIDYYSAAIEYIKGHSTNYMSAVATNGNVVNYTCDWTLEM